MIITPESDHDIADDDVGVGGGGDDDADVGSDGDDAEDEVGGGDDAEDEVGGGADEFLLVGGTREANYAPVRHLTLLLSHKNISFCHHGDVDDDYALVFVLVFIMKGFTW